MYQFNFGSEQSSSHCLSYLELCIYLVWLLLLSLELCIYLVWLLLLFCIIWKIIYLQWLFRKKRNGILLLDLCVCHFLGGGGGLRLRLPRLEWTQRANATGWNTKWEYKSSEMTEYWFNGMEHHDKYRANPDNKWLNRFIGERLRFQD